MRISALEVEGNEEADISRLFGNLRAPNLELELERFRVLVVESAFIRRLS